MAIIDPNAIPIGVPVDEDRYWRLVKGALSGLRKARQAQDIQTASPDELAAAADELRNDVSQRPRDEQILFYHAEPLDVAADIIGLDDVNQSDVIEYQNFRDTIV
jgi:hypothetical protein